MVGEVVPFGKYKDRPAEEMIADAAYCQWLLAQPWFAEKYGNVYNLVINYGTEPQDTPEHNALQARLLHPEFVQALLRVVSPEYAGRAVYQLKFEDIFDVSFTAGHEASYGIECKPTIADDYPSVLRQVLAQIKRWKIARYGSPTYTVVIYGALNPSSVPEEAVIQIFDASGIKLVSVREIEACL